jgi:hypothetical protein
MAEKSNTQIKALQISTEIDFDKDDVAAIAVAEAEAHIRRTINRLTAQVKYVTDGIEKSKKKVVNIGEALIEIKFAQKVKVIKAGLVQTKIPRLVVEVIANIDIPKWEILKNSSTAARHVNYYSISIVKMDKDNVESGTMKIEENSLPMNKEQHKLVKLIHDEKNKLRLLKKDAIDWRRKLSDIPALERQVRAKLAKDHLSKSKEGKAMIQNLINNFDETVKLLGM